MSQPAVSSGWRPAAPRASAQGEAERPGRGTQLQGLAEAMVAALRGLDARLAAACDAVHVLHGGESRRDLFRGLHVTADDAARALGRTPVAPLFGPITPGEPLLPQEAWAGTRFARLALRFGLAAFDLDVLLVALAPEIDGRYERLFAFVQDDVQRRRPTVELALNLLCASVPEKLERLARLGTVGPLLRAGLVEVRAPAADPAAPRLARELVVDPAVVGHLLGDDSLPEPLSRFCGTAASGADPAQPIHLPAADGCRYLRTSDPAQALEEAAASAGPGGILIFDARAALASAAPWEPLVAALLRTGVLQDRGVLLDGADELLADERRLELRTLLERLGDHPTPIFLSGAGPWEPAVDAGPAVMVTDLERPGPELRQRMWVEHLGVTGAEGNGGAVSEVAGRFGLTRPQIARAARHATRLAAKRGAVQPGHEELFEGARAQGRTAFGGLATRLEPTASWGDLVLPVDALAQLRELANRVAHRDTVLGRWGFGRRRTAGKGTAALFAGPPGTGKTFAAGVLARQLGLDLHRVDLSRVVSKYIGETEKHLARLFDRAETATAILLFDEAEALFGKRSEVRDAHDRYANQELAYLLQRIEQFEGLSILTTNMPGSMDEAFRRRLAATVYFPMPDEAARRRLWAGAWPAGAPLAADLDLDLLAARLRIPGGVIAQAALAAAYLAAGEGAAISLRHVLHAVRRELDVLGTPMPAFPALAAVERR